MDPNAVSIIYPLLPIYEQFPDLERSVFFLPKEERSLFEFCFKGVEHEPMHWPSLAQGEQVRRDHTSYVASYIEDMYRELGIVDNDHYLKNGMVAHYDGPVFKEKVEFICERFHALVAPNKDQEVIVRELDFKPKAIIIHTELCQKQP